MNPAFLRLFGYTREEAIATNAVDTYVNPGDRKAFLKALGEKGFAEDFRLRLKKKDGAIMECLLTATAQRDPEGAVQAYHGTIRDETEKNRVERAWRDSEVKLQSALAGSPAAQFAIDQNHRVIHWNRALELMTGVRPKKCWARKITGKDSTGTKDRAWPTSLWMTKEKYPSGTAESRAGRIRYTALTGQRTSSVSEARRDGALLHRRSDPGFTGQRHRCPGDAGRCHRGQAPARAGAEK